MILLNLKILINFYFHPSFIQNNSIKNSIKSVINTNYEDLRNSKLLDIGCGSMPYKPLFEKLNIRYDGIDFRQYSINNSFLRYKPDYYFPKEYINNYRLPRFSKQSYDIVTAFEVIEHHASPEVLFSEVNRILKANGLFIISFPFLWELHEEPNDYQRLTHYKIQRLCKQNNMEILWLTKRGGTFSVISQLFNMYLIHSKIHKILKEILTYFILWPSQIFAILLDKFCNSSNDRGIFLGYTFLIKKL
jgi:SAM-dependent methyltransferase